MSKVAQISDRNDSAMSISPLIALKEMVEDIESGKLDIKQLVVSYINRDNIFDYRCAQVTVSDTCYILSINQTRLMDLTRHYED